MGIVVQSGSMLEKLSPRLHDSEPLQRCCLDECRAACCLHGAWIDRVEAQEILQNADLILPHMPEAARQPAAWLDGRCEPDRHTLSGEVVHTTVLPAPEHYGGTACIFLRNDHKCALQVAAAAAGEHPWRFKPFYCILHPLDLDDEGRITLDARDVLLAEPASCLRASEQSVPLAITFEAELVYLLGEKAYRRFLQKNRMNRPKRNPS
jgi:hypothetical protein